MKNLLWMSWMRGLRYIIVGSILLFGAVAGYRALQNRAFSNEEITKLPVETTQVSTKKVQHHKRIVVASNTVLEPLPASNTTLLAHSEVLNPKKESSLSAELYTYFGSKLNAEAPEASFTFEPNLIATVAEQTSLSLLATIDRPTNAYENFAVPRLRLRGRQSFDLIPDLGTAVELSVQAMDLHRWNDEGAMVRHSVALRVQKAYFDALKITVKGAPFVQTNAYRQTTAGITKSQYGFSESLTFEYAIGRTLFTAEGILTQRYTSLWKNDYSTALSVEYSLDNFWSFGASHELLSQIVNESTGRYSSFQLFDGRESRYSVFIGMHI